MLALSALIFSLFKLSTLPRDFWQGSVPYERTMTLGEGEKTKTKRAPESAECGISHQLPYKV